MPFGGRAVRVLVKRTSTIRQAPEAAELEVVSRLFENGVDRMLPDEPSLLDIPGPHAARHAIFISIAAARRRAAVARVPRGLAAAAVLIKAVGPADAAPRVGDGARRRAVRVRAAGGRGRARLAPRRNRTSTSSPRRAGPRRRARTRRSARLIEGRSGGREPSPRRRRGSLCLCNL